MEDWNVDLIEYEEGWGKRHLITKTFDNYEAAVSYVDRTNATLTEKTPPSYYIKASEPYLTKR